MVYSIDNGGFWAYASIINGDKANMNRDTLKLVIIDQQADRHLPQEYVPRSSEAKLNILGNNKEIIVLTGIRRCGKSVLLQYVLHKNDEENYYLNFEDDRLATFSLSDFQSLQEIFIELYGIQKIYYFDEIQNIEGWELFVRRLYNNGNKIYITGSNATLFSEELGTRLTGRYIALRIFPFSFYEFLSYQNPKLSNKVNLSTLDIGEIKNKFGEYIELGGFPEYVKFQQVDYLHSLYESILYRDIIARYKISNSKSIKELIFYLASNCSKEMTFSSLRKLLGLGSVTTISNYCHYLENSFLCFFVNRYSHSVKTQIVSPKKIYFIDHILAKIIGFRFSEEKGRMLENIVFIELKRRGFEIFYHKMNKECDFIIRQANNIVAAIQVCQSLYNEKTKLREIEGLVEALKHYTLTEGIILTEHEEESFEHQLDNMHFKIHVMPIWKWLIGKF